PPLTSARSAPPSYPQPSLLDAHGAPRGVVARLRPGPEREQRIRDRDANPVGRYGVHVGVAHVDLEIRRRSIDSHHRLLDPVRDATDIAGMDRAVAGGDGNQYFEIGRAHV